MKAPKRRSCLVAGLAAIGASTLAMVLYLQRVEIFLVPPLWQSVMGVHEELERLGSSDRPVYELKTSDAWSPALDRLLRLQGVMVPEQAKLGLHPVLTEEDVEAYLVQAVHLATEDPDRDPGGDAPGGRRLKLVLLNGDGRLQGTARELRRSGWKLVQGHIDGKPGGVYLGMENTPLYLKLGFDRRGVFPMGHVLAKESSTRVVFDHRSLVPRTLWPERDEWSAEGLFDRLSREELRDLLRSSHRGDRFRAVFGMGFSQGEDAALAIPLLSHPDADLRAFAVSVVGCEGPVEDELKRLLQDSAAKARQTAALVLLKSEDPKVARRALILLLDERSRALLSRLDCEFERLCSRKVARSALSWVESEPTVPAGEIGLGDSLFGLLDWISADDLAGLVPRIIALRRAKARLGMEEDGTVLRWLARAGDESADRLLSEVLSNRLALHGDELAEQVLTELYFRSIPLDDSLVGELRLIGDGDLEYRESVVSLAVLVLARWEAPGAWSRFDEFLRRPDSRLWDVLGEDSLFYRTRVPRSPEPDDWLDPLPLDALREVVELALDAPETYLEKAVQALDHRSSRGNLFLLSSSEFLTAFLGRYDDPAADRFVDALVTEALREIAATDVRWLKVLPVLLWHQWRPLGSPELLRLVKETAKLSSVPAARHQWAGRPVPFEVSALSGRDTNRASESQAVFCRWAGDKDADVVSDPALAASLLLLRWNVPGAKERFFARVREPGNTWLFDVSVDYFLPPRLLPDLRQLASHLPERYGRRVENLEAWMRFLEPTGDFVIIEF